MPLVPTVRTTTTELEMTISLIKGWRKLFNETPSKESICIIMAQHQLETGNYNAWNWNIANIKFVAANGNVPYVALKNVWEIVDGKRIILDQSDPGSWFRAFNTLDEGIEFYLKFIANGRYKKAWEFLKQGDPRAFVTALKNSGYFTAPLEDYIKAEMIYFNKFMKTNNYEKAITSLTPPIAFEPKTLPEQPILHPDHNLPIREDKELPDDGPLKLTRWQKIVDFFTGWRK